MVVAGTKDAVLMVESEAKELTEDQMLGAVLYAHQEMQTVINAINELVGEAGKPRWDWQAPAADAELVAAVEAAASGPLGDAYRITEKAERYERVGQVKDEVVALLATEKALRKTTSRTFLRALRSALSAVAFWRASRALTGAIIARFARLPARWISCPRRTDRHSLPGVRRKRLVR